MNAREYFNKHGYKHCKSACIQNGWLNTGFWIELKRLVESWGLIESIPRGYEGLKSCRDYCDPRFCLFHSEKYKQAIADVESCIKPGKKLEGCDGST